MSQASFRFYAELNHFFPVARRKVDAPCTFEGTPPVKEAIEDLGIPHGAVDLILVNGESVDFSHCIENGDRVSVYPVFESLDITSVIRLRASPLRQPRFVVDVHLDRLARHLRMAGFDTLYRNDYTDAELLGISVTDARILLSKDRGLLGDPRVLRGYFVRERKPRQQLLEVLERFDLASLLRPLERCLDCNRLLEAVRKEAVLDQLPAMPRQRHDVFFACDGCGKTYWEGSHHAHMERFMAEVERELESRT